MLLNYYNVNINSTTTSAVGTTNGDDRNEKHLCAIGLLCFAFRL